MNREDAEDLSQDIMNGVDLKKWEDSIGIWESNGEIVGIANSEGESRGEAFFQVDKSNIQDVTLEEMFDFTEDKLWIEKEGRRFIQLRIPDGDEKRESIAINRGFMKQEWSEITSELLASEIQNSFLPNGFYFKTGDELSDMEKGMAHAKAFGYFDKDIYVKRVPLGYHALRQMADYRAYLDLSVVCETGEIVSFCTMWYDQANKIGILEPVGTVPEFRKMGLGRAVIYEAISCL